MLVCLYKYRGKYYQGWEFIQITIDVKPTDLEYEQIMQTQNSNRYTKITNFCILYDSLQLHTLDDRNPVAYGNIKLDINSIVKINNLTENEMIALLSKNNLYDGLSHNLHTLLCNISGDGKDEFEC